jgi:hypothetical protein
LVQSVIILKHERAPKTAAYMVEAMKALFQYLKMKIDVMQTEDQVVIRVPYKRVVQDAATMTR